MYHPSVQGWSLWKTSWDLPRETRNMHLNIEGMQMASSYNHMTLWCLRASYRYWMRVTKSALVSVFPISEHDSKNKFFSQTDLYFKSRNVQLCKEHGRCILPLRVRCVFKLARFHLTILTEFRSTQLLQLPLRFFSTQFSFPRWFTTSSLWLWFTARYTSDNCKTGRR